jgi:membrane-bound ClpP family serine protease
MAIIGFFDGIQLYQVAILVAGLIFLIIEMFSPGFGVSGSIGLVLLVVGILITASTAFEALVMFIILLIIVALALMVILRSARKGRLSRTLILNDELNKESGFTGTEELEHYVDKEGIALSTLRPAGTAEFDGVKLDVVTDGEYVQIGTRVKIIKVEGRRIVVKSVK